MLESKATSQLGAIAKGSVQDQGQWLSAVVKIKSNCREQLSRSRAIVKRSCHDQEQLSSVIVTIKSHCQAQVVKIKSIAEQKQLSRAVVKIRSIAEQKQLSRAVVKIKSNRQSGAEASVRCDRQEQSSRESRSNR